MGAQHIRDVVTAMERVLPVMAVEIEMPEIGDQRD
jgi:hypothetical protein